MIEQRKAPRGWNRHHTLYYRRSYESRRDTRQWREHATMIIPMDIYHHNLLHVNTPPVHKLATPELTQRAIEWCFLLDDDPETITPLEGFTSMRDEFRDYHRRNSQSALGREALRFADQFTQQLSFMREIPQY